MADGTVCFVEGNETHHRFGDVEPPREGGPNRVCACGAVIVKRVGRHVAISTRTQRVLMGGGD